ncbi:unnamed protein product [Ostreobium quekettii]|uniref:Uncharacterized protein n=1 Tax=Ostreobium quekettii TaxID=121088 RepID=A0A8S1JBZ7_9CHLO|nr:unnamed protein product [Ostreobium quekettii]|eukprot:evm.model.scf_3472.1 EVM.evm.TU.scf_3472.1   scf_3472:5102-6703(+)
MSATTEFDFEDLLFAASRGEERGRHAGDGDAPPPGSQEPQRGAREATHRRQISALSAAMCAESLRGLSLDDGDDATTAEDEADHVAPAAGSKTARRKSIASPADALPNDGNCLTKCPSDGTPLSKWARMEGSHPLRLGSSAPVSIPHGAHTWTRTQDALSEVEEEEDGQPKATTFVPPHLMVDKPAIQFSLHGSTAEKKAKLRARNTILQMTGFLEPARATEKGWNHAVEPPADADSGWNRSVGRAIRAPGALTKEFSVTKLDSLDK